MIIYTPHTHDYTEYLIMYFIFISKITTMKIIIINNNDNNNI